MVDLRKGSCLCGTTQYEVNLDGHETSNCHCLDCQKNSGAAFMTFTSLDVGQFRWLSKPLGEIRASPIAVRRFCQHCGTPMTWESPLYKDRISFSTATVEGGADLAITYEIFTKNRWPAFKPVNGARQYEESN